MTRQHTSLGQHMALSMILAVVILGVMTCLSRQEAGRQGGPSFRGGAPPAQAR